MNESVSGLPDLPVGRLQGVSATEPRRSVGLDVATIDRADWQTSRQPLFGVLYAAAIFLAAFLLFAIEPMVGKLILPSFGGSAAVWTACLLFFQVALLVGYLYAYGLTHLPPTYQALAHLALLTASLGLLPASRLSVSAGAVGADPTLEILGLLARSIGLPFLLLSATGPLLQAWYSRGRPGSAPYRLYAVSNLGSMIALLGYPFAIEPALSTSIQLKSWSIGYLVFAGLCGGLARASLQHADRRPALVEGGSRSSFAWSRFGVCVALAACPAALLIAITAELTHNIAPIPLLWVLPLAVYLLTFIVCFERPRVYRRTPFMLAVMVALCVMAFVTTHNRGNPSLLMAIPPLIGGLCICSMFCHGELARLKPETPHLTAFYLAISTGGAIGGVVVAVVAPRVLSDYHELPALFVYCGLLATLVVWNCVRLDPPIRNWTLRVWMLAITVVIGCYLVQHAQTRRPFKTWRNFYGVLGLQQVNVPGGTIRLLSNGTITHGLQITRGNDRRQPTAYFGISSGVGRAIRSSQTRGPINVGVIGLGAGVMASYCRGGDRFQFYEINPLVVEIAAREFTFLADCPSTPVIHVGDGRLELARQPPQEFDLLVVDAFTSDSVPVHLLTREAFEMYFTHLRPSGLLAINVANRYLDLAQIVVANAQQLGKVSTLVLDPGNKECCLASTWTIVSSNALDATEFHGRGAYDARARSDVVGWTDDYSSLFRILRW